MTTSALTVENFKDKLANDPLWTERGLLVIYGYQTASEQDLGHTTDHNGVGFSGSDSEFLSSLAERVQKFSKGNARFAPKPVGSCLSPKQLKWAQRLMPKYAKQLLNHAKSKPKPTSPAPAEHPDAEMARMEAEGDRNQTLLDEQRKAIAKAQLERGHNDRARSHRSA
jgi:hypothetical protein